MTSHTQFAPVALLGARLHQRDFFAPLREQLHLQQTMVFDTPDDKRLTCLVRMMSGCHAVCQMATRMRPETALAHAWGLESFAQQSTVADTLDRFTDVHVQPLRAVISCIY